MRQWMAVEYADPPVFNVESLISEGDQVVAVGKISLRDLNGRIADYLYSDVWRFKEGKMAELKAFVIKTNRDRN